MPKQPSAKRLRRILYSLGQWAGSHNPKTGGQTSGPVWTGRPKPRRPHVVDYAAIPKEIREHNRPLEEKQLGFGVQPGSGLHLLLQRLPRRQRRMLLATVQSADTPRRRRLQRRFVREATALGIRPA